MTDDELLMEYLRTKDDGLFTTLYERMYDGLCAVARRIAPDDAEDIVQDAFCKLSQLEPKEITTAFVVKMVQTAAMYCLRRKKRRNEVSLNARLEASRRGDQSDELADDADGPGVQLHKKESCEEIKLALDFLPRSQRDAIRTYFDSGETIETIAERTGIPAKTIASRIQRGLEALPRHIISARHGEKPVKRNPRPYPRSVCATDPATGAVVRQFVGVKDAMDAGYSSFNCLYRALRTGTIYKGLKWTYASAT